MIKVKEVRQIVRKEYKKKIGKSALLKLNSIAEEYIKEILKKASRKADINGRVIIKENDFEI